MKDETSTPDSYRVKYEKLGSDELIAQLWQNEELPKGTIFSVNLPDLAHPITMRAGTSDMWVFDQIFLYKEMETDLGQNISFIIDAGANIGLTSAYLANRFPSAKILAFGGRSTELRTAGCKLPALSQHHASVEGFLETPRKSDHRQSRGISVGFHGF